MSTVAVVGGGFAGLAAATHLADRGHRVTVLERRTFLGGKAYSFDDPDLGHPVDNGQHAFLMGYRNTRALLDRWGSGHLLTFQPRLDLTFRSEASVDRFLCAPLPAPLHLLVPLLCFGALPLGDRLAMARAALALLALGGWESAGRRSLEGMAFGDWLRHHGQGEAALSRFWEVLSLAALNDPADRVSASGALQVLAAGFLTSAEASRFGYAKEGLSSLYRGFGPYLAERGGTLLLGQELRELATTDGGWELRTADRRLTADAVVLACPPKQLSRLLPADLGGRPPLDALPTLPTSPIVSVHLRLDRPVVDRPVTALLDSPIHWIFDAGAIRDDVPAGSLSLVVSGARDLARASNEQIRALAISELVRLVPAARHVQVLGCRVVKEPEATLALVPGLAALRPGPETGVPGLFLAGAWTATGLPSTIEGAVMSGLSAVEAVERAWGRECRLVEAIERPDPLVNLVANALKLLPAGQGMAGLARVAARYAPRARRGG